MVKGRKKGGEKLVVKAEIKITSACQQTEPKQFLPLRERNVKMVWSVVRFFVQTLGMISIWKYPFSEAPLSDGLEKICGQ